MNRKPNVKTIAVFLVLFIAISLLGTSIDVSARTLAATSPTLGAAASYSVLAGEAVTNTGPTTMPGSLGVSPGSAVTGFPPGIVGPPGTIHAADADALNAQIDNSAAFDFLASQGCTETYAGVKDLVGLSLIPGVYCAGSFELSGTLTLEGSGVWIFKSDSTLITSGTANIVGGDPCNVWWRVVSSATLGTNTSLIGNILASTSISLATGANLNGRALAQTGAVTLDSNTFSGPVCYEAPIGTPTPINTLPAGATATLLPIVTALPDSGGAQLIQNASSSWVLGIVGLLAVAALIFGVRAFSKTYRSK
jgi:hypothetical protein